jgi:hypothetical protein
MAEFCDKVIRTITDSVNAENFQKVTMYQDIWYLVSKYNVPVEDHSVDIVVLIDELCNGDNGESPEAEEPINNDVDIGPVEAAPSKPWSGGRRPPSVVTKGLPGLGSRGDFSFYPAQGLGGQVREEAATRAPFLSPSYPRVVAYTPRMDNTELHHDNHQAEPRPEETVEAESTFLLPSPTGQPFPAPPARLPAGPPGEEVSVITLYPDLDIRHMERQGYQVLGPEPQDVMVETSFSFGADGRPRLSQGSVSNIANHALPDSANSIQTFKVEKYADKARAPALRFTPSEMVGTSPPPPPVLLTTPLPAMRRGTVEDLPRSRPTLPPVVRTSSLTRPSPDGPPALLEPYEEPSRSSEEGEDSAFPLSRHSPQYVSAPGYFPPPPQPYPRPSPPPGPFPRSPSSAGMAASRRDHYDREDGAPVMANKMDDMEFIDGYIDTSSLPRVAAGYAGPGEARPQERRDPGLSALTLEQLSVGLEGPRGPTTQTSTLRNYTLFDMADAVAVTSSLPLAPASYPRPLGPPPPPVGLRRDDRPFFTTYSADSATAPSEPAVWYAEQEYNTQRPEESDQQPVPSSSYDNPLIVDSPQQMTQEDLMFLYNITFLTDTDQAVVQRPVLPLGKYPAAPSYPNYPIEGPDYLQYEDQYEPDPADYPTFPLERPSNVQVGPENFSEAIEEFLAEYDTYSQAVEKRGSNGEPGGALDSLLGKLDLGPGLLESQEFDYRELLEETEERVDMEEEEGGLGWPGHQVNHRTHSVPDFANQLIRGRQGEEADLKSTAPPPLPMPGFRFTQPPSSSTTSTTTTTTTSTTTTTTTTWVPRLKNHQNHKPVFPASPGSLNRLPSHDGVKEVLMVLNATGKINSKEIRDGYYPESVERMEKDGAEELSDMRSGEADTLTMELDGPRLRSTGAGDGSNAAAATNRKAAGDNTDDTNDAADLEVTETTTEPVEFSSFYPMSSQEPTEATTESIVEVYDNLSNLVDTWDEDTNLYEDQVARDLADLNREIAALEAQEALENKLFKNRDDNFPLKSFMSEPSPGLKLEANLAKAEGQQGLNPEKLAYILIGVCCGLSVLCLIVVAVSIGYKSETHYRLEEPQRKRIRLLKASHGSDSDSSSASSQDTGTGDRSRAKLGNWFTGKHTIQTMDRKSNLVFPTSVYLDNLASSATHSTLSRSHSSGSDSPSPSGSNNNLFERGRDRDAGSITSVQTDPNLVEEPEEEHEVGRRGHSKAVGAAVSKSSYAVSASRLSGTITDHERSGRER